MSSRLASSRRASVAPDGSWLLAVSRWPVLLCRVGTHDLCVRLRQRLHRQDRSTTDALPLDTLVCPCRATYPSDTSDTSDCSDLLRYLRSLTSNLPSISNLQVGVVLSERVVRHSRKKSWSKVWWFREVVLPLHSQLKRTGLRRCLESLEW